jgi:hypothetical protein
LFSLYGLSQKTKGKKMNAEDTDTFRDLIRKIDKVLDGASADDAIPALTSFLGAVGAFSNISKRTLLSYVASALDKTYAEFESRKK